VVPTVNTNIMECFATLISQKTPSLSLSVSSVTCTISHCNQSSVGYYGSSIAFNRNGPTTSSLPANWTQTNWTRT